MSKGYELYRHRRTYVARLLDTNGFIPLRQLEFPAAAYPDEHENASTWAYVARVA